MESHFPVVRLDVLLEQDEDGVWAVSVPALPGCFSQGETRKGALANIKEAILLHLATSKPLPLQSVELGSVTLEA